MFNLADESDEPDDKIKKLCQAIKKIPQNPHLTKRFLQMAADDPYKM